MREYCCPACDARLAPGDLNLREGAALCPACHELSRLRDVLDRELMLELEAAARGEPPHGCRREDFGPEIRLRSATRGGPTWFLLFFAVFWNVIISIFVFMAAAGLYRLLGGTLPPWVRNIKGNGSPATMSAGDLVLMGLVLTPFILVGAGTAAVALTGLVGRVEVTLSGAEGRVFCGIAGIGWRRRFNADAVRRVSIGETAMQSNRRPVEGIIIEADRKLVFGTLVSARRQRWLAGMLRLLLIPQPRAAARERAPTLSADPSVSPRP